jgi:hypothetical protein
MFKQLRNTFYGLISAVLIFQLIGCGTILYPERKGQKGGRLDAGVVILDAIGLLFFFIPGVIAFAVDFNNGTIYVPGTSRSSLENSNDIKEVKFDPKHSSFASIEKIIKEQTGQTVKLNQSNMKITKLKSTNDMMMHFAQMPSGSDNRIVLNY